MLLERQKLDWLSLRNALVIYVIASGKGSNSRDLLIDFVYDTFNSRDSFKCTPLKTLTNENIIEMLLSLKPPAISS